jgi:hypothetical protein
MEEKGKTSKIQRRLKRLDDEALILQKMYFNPSNFALIKLLIHDKTNERIMNMNFDDFVTVENKDYPGIVNMNFLSDENEVNLKVRMAGFSTEKINSFSLNIPKKYKQVIVN